MKRLACLTLLATFAVACTRASSATNDRLDDLDRRTDKMMAAIDKPLPPGAAQLPAHAGTPPANANANGPDEKVLWSVPIDGDPVKGPANAKVTIVEGADFACPFCRRAEPTVTELAQLYGDQVRFVFKEYVVHPQVATLPAMAACAAGEQHQFWEMKSAIWESAWALDPNPHMKDSKLLGQDNMEVLAKNLGLDLAKFKTDMASDKCKQLLDRDAKQLSAIGADGTPTFVINGHLVLGALPVDQFKTIIDDEIKKADEAYKKGVKPEDYYATLVAQGKKG